METKGNRGTRGGIQINWFCQILLKQQIPMWFHKRPLPVINSNPFYPFPRKPIRQFNLAFFSYSQHNHRRGDDIQLASCRDGRVKTMGGVARTSDAIDLRGVEGQRGIMRRTRGSIYPFFVNLLVRTV